MPGFSCGWISKRLRWSYPKIERQTRFLLPDELDFYGDCKQVDNRQSALPPSFVLFSCATFLSFLGMSSISYFSVMLAEIGLSREEIGWILSSALVPVLIGILSCGELLARFSALQLAVFGQAVMLIGYATFLMTIADPVGAALSRGMIGAGFGLFFPAALIYARSLVDGPRSVFLFGIYSTMIPLPNLIGPGLAEVIYTIAGTQAVLWMFSACMGAGVLAALFLPAMEKTRTRAEPIRFMAILMRRETLLPNLSIGLVGLLCGFSLSFMALYLHRFGIAPTIFFSTSTAAMVISRFTIMARLGQKSREFVSASGLALMAVGYLILPVWSLSVPVVFVSALIFGLGYSLAFPVLSMWATDLYPVAQRGRPMAVFTGIFQSTIFLIPVLTGLFSGGDGYSPVLIALATASCALAMVLYLAGLRRRAAA